jgi:hypothetical protein
MNQAKLVFSQCIRGSIPTFIHITDSKVHEVNTLNLLHIKCSACYLLDRGYLGFHRLLVIHQADAFLSPAPSPIQSSSAEFKRRYSSPADRASSSIVSDQTGVLSIFSSNKDYPAPQSRVVVKDEWQASHVFDQQLRPQTRVDRRLLPPALAGRVVLQVDQTAPADQDVFWNHRERGQGADLDCSLHLRADRDCQETLTSAQ